MTPHTTTAPRARLHDPSTSHAAAERSLHFSGGHADRILAALDDGRSRNAQEIGDAIGLTVVQVDRRTVELQRRGYIRVLRANGQDVVRNGMRVWVKA